MIIFPGIAPKLTKSVELKRQKLKNFPDERILKGHDS